MLLGDANQTAPALPVAAKPGIADELKNLLGVKSADEFFDKYKYPMLAIGVASLVLAAKK